MTYAITLLNKETQAIKYVYAFNYLELLSLLPRVNPEIYHIQVTEANNVYDLTLFLSKEENLISEDFWIDLNNKINDFNEDDLFGLN